MREILALALSVAGSVIGAGFATGNELRLFFPGSGWPALALLVLSLALMALCGCLFFLSEKRHPSGNQLLSLFFLLFSLAAYSVMLSCGGETLRELLPLPAAGGIGITFLLSLFAANHGIQGVYRFHRIAAPLLLGGMVMVSILGLFHPVECFEPAARPVVSMLCYAGYNLLTLLPFVRVISHTATEQKGLFGIVGGLLIVAVSGILIKLLLLRWDALVSNQAIPLLPIMRRISPGLSLLYSLMLYLSVLTTAVNSLYAVCGENKAFGLALLPLCGSFLGFDTLMKTLYTAFGYLGIGIMAILIPKGWKTLCFKRKESKV